MNLITGVGGWVWHTETFKDNAHAIINSGVNYVFVKVNDGANSFNDGDQIRDLIKKLNAANISVYGWGYVRPNNIVEAAKLASLRCKALNMEYYSVDFEIEFENVSKTTANTAADSFINTWKEEAPNVSLLGSSFYTPSLHPGVPYTEFMKGCQYWQPQVYWENHDPITTVINAYTAGKALGKQMVFSLPSYDMRNEGGKFPTASEMVAAADKAFLLGAKAVDFFSFDDAITDSRLMDGIMQTTKKYAKK